MTIRYRITVDGATYDVEVGDISASPVTVLVDGVEFEVEFPDAPAARTEPTQPAPSPRRRETRPSSGTTCAPVCRLPAGTVRTLSARRCPDG